MQHTAVFMIDGFDIRYFDRRNMPVMADMAGKGFFRQGSAIFPSLTNANNISIACGAWPETHGVTTNCYYDPELGTARFLESPDFLLSPTVFEMKTGKGKSVLLTCKSKTAKILGHMADIAVAAEEPEEFICRKYGTPPPMYSAEINYWLTETAVSMVKEYPVIDLIYIHTTDYPMHMWAPEEDESKEHMNRLDSLLGEFHKAAPHFGIALTADHGMNAKKTCIDLAKACRARGLELLFAVSPVADRLLKHHGGFGGVSYVYLKKPEDAQRAAEIFMSLAGVERVMTGAEAAARFSLMPSRVGDLVVLPDRDTVFGDLKTERVSLPENYRSHGSLHELDIPLLLYNFKDRDFRFQDINFNLDLTRQLFINNGDKNA